MFVIVQVLLVVDKRKKYEFLHICLLRILLGFLKLLRKGDVYIHISVLLCLYLYVKKTCKMTVK